MVEIYFEDLNEEGKKKVLKEAEIDEPEEANWDVFPLFTLGID